MLATPELIREAAQIPRLEGLLPRWRAVPLYRNSLARVKCERPNFECFQRLPLLAKPRNAQRLSAKFSSRPASR